MIKGLYPLKKLFPHILNKDKSVQKRLGEIEYIFARARAELMNPPVNFSIEFREKGNIGFKFLKGEGKIFIPKDLLYEENFNEIFLWFSRHLLSHIHYCPYDMKTALELEKNAYKVCKDWSIAYLSLFFLSDMQIDFMYLPETFNDIPGHLSYRFRFKPSGIMELLYSAYLTVYPDHLPKYKVDPIIRDYGKQLAFIIFKTRPWSAKIKIIASILSKIESIIPRKISRKKIKKSIQYLQIPVREDVKASALNEIMETYGGIKDLNTAKEIFEQWIKPRVDMEKLEKEMKKYLKEIKGRRQGKKQEKLEEKKSTQSLKSEDREPVFPTSLSKLLTKIDSRSLSEALWKRFWYKARAQRILMDFISMGRLVKPTWTITAYPDQWLVEDEIEDLDLEISLDEGPIIPEITTLKWVNIPSGLGHTLSTAKIPSAIILLDSSQSMTQGFNNAATAAFIIYLSAKKAGGNISIINFSTNYLIAPWKADENIKEIMLSIHQGGYTILPVHIIKDLIEEAYGKIFIFIVSDCGWQNVDEALKLLRKISERGHELYVFHIYGYKYREKVRKILKSPHISLIHIEDPERDLEGIVLEEAVKAYGKFF